MTYKVLNYTLTENGMYIPTRGYLPNSPAELLDHDEVNGLIRLSNGDEKEIPLNLLEGYYQFEVRNHELNDDLEVILQEGMTGYTAYFLRWTTQPGIGVFQCSDKQWRLLSYRELRPLTERESATDVLENDKISELPAYYPYLELPPQWRVNKL